MEVAKKERKKRRRGQVVPLGGDSFKLRVPLGRDGTGKRKYHTETLHNATPTKAEKRCTELLAEVDSGSYFEPARVSVKDFIEREWLPQKVREGVRVASSMKAYRGVASRYIIPALGHLPLARVTPRDVQRLYNSMQDAGRYDAPMKLTRNVLGMVFRQAVLWHYLKANPAEGVRLPASTKPPRSGYAFTKDEALRFIKAASEEPDDLAYLFHLFTGLRPEELAGLGWQHVRFDEARECGVASVERVVLWPNAREFVFAPPKTKKSRRPVFFPAHIYRALEAQRAAQATRSLRLGGLWRDCQLVFPRPTGEPLDVRCAYARRLRELAARAEIKQRVTPYCLRYSFATLALLAGELDVSVSRQMGHTRTDFTKDVYVKVLPEMQQRLSGLFERLLTEATGNQVAHFDAPGVM
ncbi:MAG TPA: site-specific integrase [Pyrinomonadaceae bacterium]|jgi:integrase|nr:site-specific integrase [Pyrinomonadaceae bacterium]